MYKKMYYVLFNAITDSLEQMEEKNYGQAEAILKDAQRRAERLYMESAGQDEKKTASSAQTTGQENFVQCVLRFYRQETGKYQELLDNLRPLVI